MPATYDQGIFELRVGRAAAETMQGLLSPAGTILLPIDRVIALTAMPAQRTDSSVTIERARNAGPSTLVLGSHRLVDAKGVVVLRDDELVLAEGVYFLATSRIADFLGATVDSDLGQLAVTLTRSPPFPVEQSAARAQRTAGGIGRTAALAGAPVLPFVPRSGGAVMDWNVSTLASGSSLSGSNGNVRLAAALFGGDVSAGVGISGDGNGGTHTGDAQWSYRRGLPDNRVVRQFQLGDILGGGSQLRSLRGVTLTNARFVADPFFGSVPVDLNLPQGWQYEVYQDGRLLGFSDPGARGPLMVPLRYGNTPVQVRLVSPTGDETVRDFSYLIPQSQQQPGRFEYTAGAGRCTSACESTVFGSASYGVLPWLSVSGGAERQTTDGITSFRPEGGVSVLTYSGWNAQLQAASESFERASLLYGGLGTLLGSASYTRSHNGVGQPSVVGDGVGTRWLFNSLLQLRPASERWASGWRLDNTLEGVEAGSADRMRSVLTMDRTNGSVGLSYETDHTRDLHEMGVSVLTVLTRNARASSLLGTLLFDAHSVHALELSTSLQAGRRGATALMARWQRGTGVLFSVGYNGALGAMRLTSRFSATPRQPPSLATAASGSTALDGREMPLLFEGPGVGLAGITGRVFYDLDGDGAFGSADLPARGVRVVVNGSQSRSDSTGSYRVWNVVPYEPAEIALDTLAFSDPSWTLLRGRTVLRATPGMFNRLDFPLVRTRELAGSVVSDSGIATVSGVTLALTPADGGATVRILTFSDGSFYVSRVRPGRYTLTVAPSALQALGADAMPASQLVEVTAGANDPVLDVAPIRLRRRPTEAKPGS